MPVRWHVKQCGKVYEILSIWQEVFLCYTKIYSFAELFNHLSVIQFMKRGVSIALILLILTAMLNLSVATHYCGGKIAASKVSLTGKLASCGMAGSEKKLPLSGTSFTTHCCDDIVTYCGTDSNYTPSFSFIPDSYQYNFKFFSIPAGYPVYNPAVLKSQYIDASPPGALISTNVDISDICVFRI